LVVGNSASANDVAREALTTAKKVYQSIRASSLPPLDPNSVSPVYKVPEITEFVHDGQYGSIKLQDGNQLTDVDYIVFATGYLFSLPFLARSEGEKLITDGQRVHNLYRHLFYINNPTLAFIGLPIRVVPFPISQSQSKVVARCWSGKTKLPTREEMEDWHKAQPRTERPRDDFVYGAEKEFQYMDRINMWAEGHHPDDNVDDWSSADPETGELSSRYKDRRIHAFDLRRAALGY
jgi:cation diffusion facilitator CzcD-associated flavoprotein CzcO